MTEIKRRGRPLSWQHGSTTGYANHKCRCEPCKAAWNARQKVNAKLRRDRAVAEGQCVDCVLAAVPGKRCCPKHLAERKASAARWRAKRTDGQEGHHDSHELRQDV